MSKHPDHSNQNQSENQLPPDVTVDLEAQTSIEQLGGESTARSDSSGANITSIEISDIDQTMDLTPLTQMPGAGTIDIQDANDQTMDLGDLDAKEFDGTRIFSPSMTPFQGKVFDGERQPEPEDQTKILGPELNANNQTMDLAEYTSPLAGSSDVQSSIPPDATMLLSDSQQGSHAGSSSIAGKSSYDQTMDLSESASDSRSGSDGRINASVNKTGQSVPATGRSNFKSVADSRQYLQAKRAEASDAFLDRVTERKISYTIDWNDVSADYQINKKIDPKTGKLDLHVLGKGGMGLVYLATQNSVNRPVALKVIRKDKQTEAFSKQFFYEAEITAQLEHPNITPIYELGRSPDGTFFYSMKYIQGTPWEKKIRENSIEENLEIFDKLCDAIGFAHSKNIVHMDIKPDNVQLGEYGEVYAVDWGVASNLKRPESIRCAGTWQWISPEVSRGERDKIGKGSDIYLLGGILFLIVTGHHPRLPKDSAAKMGQAGLTKAAQNNIIQPTDCKDPMVAVALKAMETDPRQRYAKVEDLQEAIYAIQKERANIKSSQELTERSIQLGKEAREHGDYDRFNRSVFGLQDAIELWDKNPEAPQELKKVRLAYGQCAFEKGDYDLALQTLVRTETLENELYVKAEHAQTAVKLRAQRIWWLSRLFVLSLLIGSGFVLSFWLKAENAREKAETAELNERDAKFLAIRAKDEAERNAIEARTQERIAAGQREIAEKQTELAEQRKDEALEAQKTAVAARQKAEDQLAKTQLTEIASRLGLARSRINEANPTGANALLTGIAQEVQTWTSQWNELQAKSSQADSKVPNPNALVSKLPNLDNWATNRISLLSNADLLGVDLPTETNFKVGGSAFAIDPKDGSLIVANPIGEIYRVSFDGKDPAKIWEKDKSDDWTGVTKVHRVVPAKDQQRIYLSLNRVQDPVVAIDLSDGKVTQFDREIPGVGQQIALSPVSRHIATTQPGYIWFTRNLPNTLGNGVPTKDQAVQIQWLTDDLLLALIENQGTYHLQLIAPFLEVDKKDNRSSYAQYTASLKIDVVQFALVNRELPEIVTSFKPEKLKNLNPKFNGERDSRQARELFAKMIGSLHFVFGQGDGNLIQTRLMPPATNEDSKSRWSLVDQIPLPRKHMHAIEEILVESQPSQSGSNRRIITRADAEQAVQVWDLSTKLSRKPSSDGLKEDVVIAHVHSLSGRPLKDDLGQTGVVFAGFDQQGQVVLINSDLIAHRLDVQEQIERERVVLETPFSAAAFQESSAKWLFPNDINSQVLSVDGYGVAALYDPIGGQAEDRSKLVDFPSRSQLLKVNQFIDPSRQDSKGRIDLHQDPQSYLYWGHSPFARIEHIALSPDQKTAVSLASIPGSKSVYLVPRDTDTLADDLKFKEVCLWDLVNLQMIDRVVFTSEASVDRLSALDENRFVFGNTETLSIFEWQTSSMLSAEMAKSAVHFCVANPVYPFDAFFRADGTQGTLWTGIIPAEKPVSVTPPRWLSKDDNRMAMMDAAPAHGCWSSDGLRLYVLDTLGQIRRYELDPQTGRLSATIGEDSPDLLKGNPLGLNLSGILASRPQQVFMQSVGSESSPNGWQDEILIGSLPQLQESGDAEVFDKPIHAVFSQNAKPAWKNQLDAPKAEAQYLALADRLFHLIRTNKDSQKRFARSHEPRHATSDASGRRLLLNYPSAVLLLSFDQGNAPIWNRIDKSFDKNPQFFSLSPDGSTLAVVDDSGLQFHRVVYRAEDNRFDLEPNPVSLANASTVKRFAWEPNWSARQQKDSIGFAYILADNTVGYFHDGTSHDLGKLCDLTVATDSPSKAQLGHEIQESEIQSLWFFKEVLTDRTKTPSPTTQLHYLAMEYRYTDPSTDLSTVKVRFFKLPFSDPTGEQALQRTCVDLDLGQTFTKVVPNQEGGIIVTGDDVGNVVVYLVSPHWGIANPVFDANSEADSAIESLSFSAQGNFLIMSNANNHLFGLPTKSTAGIKK